MQIKPKSADVAAEIEQIQREIKLLKQRMQTLQGKASAKSDQRRLAEIRSSLS